MDELYEPIKKLGSGSFGTVTKARNKKTGEVVAIKTLKKPYNSWQECLSLREFKSLRKMNNPNIMKLKDLILENKRLYFVFEYIDFNLRFLMKDKTMPFPESQVKKWCVDILLGLSHMHERGYFHRDLKPENLLVTQDFKVKIGDLGLAREMDSSPPYTEYVSTRWYRAPEMLFGLGLYGPEVDMWAVGAIMFEMLSLRPLFRGASDPDQMYKICNILGTPNEASWREGLRQANHIGYKFPKCEGVPLSNILPFASDDAISLISSLCSWDPSKRPTAEEALRHPFLRSCLNIPPHVLCRRNLTREIEESRRKIEVARKQEMCYQPPSENVFMPIALYGKEERCAYGDSYDANWISKIDWSYKGESTAFHFGNKGSYAYGASYDENWLSKIDWSFNGESTFKLPEANGINRR